MCVCVCVCVYVPFNEGGWCTYRLSHRQSTSDASNQGGSPVEDQDRESLSPARKKIKVNQKAVAAPRAQSKGKKLSAKPAGVVGGSRRKLSLHGTGEERSPRGCAMTLDACFSSSRTSLSPSPLTATAPTTSRRPSSSQMQAKLTAPKSNKSSQSAASGSHPLSFPKKGVSFFCSVFHGGLREDSDSYTPLLSFDDGVSHVHSVSRSWQ